VWSPSQFIVQVAAGEQEIPAWQVLSYGQSTSHVPTVGHEMGLLDPVNGSVITHVPAMHVPPTLPHALGSQTAGGASTPESTGRVSFGGPSRRAPSSPVSVTTGSRRPKIHEQPAAANANANATRTPRTRTTFTWPA
jgi:hypothetical protein